jgi:hypothetical protein
MWGSGFPGVACVLGVRGGRASFGGHCVEELAGALEPRSVGGDQLLAAVRTLLDTPAGAEAFGARR